MQTVQNKVAVVTGAASGIGLGMVRALTGAGAHVAMLDLEEDALTAAHGRSRRRMKVQNMPDRWASVERRQIGHQSIA